MGVAFPPHSLLVYAAFSLLVLLTFNDPRHRLALANKSKTIWTLDLLSLCIQGFAVPFLQTVCIFWICHLIFPGMQGKLSLHWSLVAALNLLAVDYCYYANHRALHSRWLWPLHLVHHTVEDMDVFATSRNSVFTHFFIVYLWCNGIFLYFLADPVPYLWAIAISASLDLWKHSTVAPSPGSTLHRLLKLVLITPHEHAWHHSGGSINYGANFSFWDRLHGTYYCPAHAPQKLNTQKPLADHAKFLYPLTTHGDLQ